MALTLEDIRTRIPELKDKSVNDIVSLFERNGLDASAIVPNKKEEAGLLRSYVSIPLLKAAGDVGGSVGYALEASGIAPETGRALQESGEQLSETLTARQSQQARDDANKKLIDENGNYGGYNLGTFSQQLLGSLPQIAVMAVPGAGAARVIGSTARVLGASEKAAELIGSSLGFGASEGAVSGVNSAVQIQQQIRATPIETLEQHPEFIRTLAEETAPDISLEDRKNIAKEIIVRKAGDQVFLDTMIKTGGIGALTGGGIFGAAARGGMTGLLPTRVAKGFINEGLAQELPQSALEQRTLNQVKKDYLNPDQDINEGVLNAGLEGGLVGGVIGMAGGAVQKRSDSTGMERLASAGNVDDAIIAANEALSSTGEPPLQAKSAANILMGDEYIPGAPSQGLPPASSVPLSTTTDILHERTAPDQTDQTGKQSLEINDIGPEPGINDHGINPLPDRLSEGNRDANEQNLFNTESHISTLAALSESQQDAVLPDAVRNGAVTDLVRATDTAPPELNATLFEPGIIGGKVRPKQILLTVTGRKTTRHPGPKLIKKTHKWLLENATLEAEARGDEFNARQFRHDINAKAIPYASRTAAEAYLFGRTEAASPVAPVAPPKTPLQTAQQIPTLVSDTLPGSPPLLVAQETNIEQPSLSQEVVLPNVEEPLLKPGKLNPPKVKKNTIVNGHDDLLAAITKLGGLSATEAKAQGIDPASFKKRGHGVRRVFHNGKTVDSFGGMAERLRQYGFTPNGPNELLDHLDRALKGEKIYNPAGYEYHAEIMAQESVSSEIAHLALRLEDLYETANQHDKDFGTDYLERLLKYGDLTNEDISAWEQDLRDERADRQTEQSKSGRQTESFGNSQTPISGETELRSYTEQELADREQDAEQRNRREQADDVKAWRKEQADKEIGSVFDEMAGVAPKTADVLGMTGPLEKPKEPEESEKPKEPEESVQKKPTHKLEDFGEKLEGAKKDIYQSMRERVPDSDIGNQPLSKIWPKPVIDDISDDFTAAFVTAARDEIPSKPHKGYKLNKWVDKVTILRQYADDLLTGRIDKEALVKKISENKILSDLKFKVELLQQLDRKLWDKVDRATSYPDAYYYDKAGEKIKSPTLMINQKSYPYQNQWTEALPDIRRDLGHVDEQADSKKFEVRRKNNQFFISRVGDSLYRPLVTFDNQADAIAFRKNNTQELSAAWEEIKDRDNVSEKDIRNAKNRPRTGQDRRHDNDVSVDEFANKFGFRGVQWGNWVAQGKNIKERQGILNEAYDALMDLSDILAIPPQAISLNGDLGLAFGSRGSGWASAHYETNTLVINLTKTRGAGTLAHEWLHALDHYFQRSRGEGKYESERFITYAPENYYQHLSGRRLTEREYQDSINKTPGKIIYPIRDPSEWRKIEGVRPEIGLAFANVVQALNESPMNKRSTLLDKGRKKYWSTIIERAARAFENYIIDKMAQGGYSNDYLANVKSWEDWREKNKERYPYLRPNELKPVSDAFDALFKTLATKETEKGTMLYSRSPSTQAAYEQRIDALFDGAEPKQRGGVIVLDSSDVLDLLGYNKDKVRIVESKVLKSSEVHRLTAEHWKQIPEWLDNPVAVFESDTVDGRLVFITPEKINGDPILMIVEPNATEGRAGETVHLLVNSYDGSSARMPMERWIKQEKLLYIDNEKSQAFSAASRLQLPTRAQQNKPGSKQKIISERDLVKYRKAQDGGFYSKARQDDIVFTQKILSELARDDEFFRFPISDKDSIEGVIKDIMPNTRHVRFDGKRHLFAIKGGGHFWIYENPDSVWIDVSPLQTGQGGSAIYFSVGNYAYNSGKKFIGDPEGLSEDAVVRRTANMLSLVLRFGAADFMEASKEQLVKDGGLDHLFSKQQATTGATVADVKSWLPRRVNALVKAGKLQVVQSATDVAETALAFDVGGIEGFYDEKADVLTLVADNITQDNLNSVLSHELLHRAKAVDPKLRAATEKFDSDLQHRFKLAARGVGSDIEKAAYRRVMDAKTPLEDQFEEFQNYIVSEYQRSPASFTEKLKKIIKDFIAAIRIALIRSGMDFGFVKTLTPSDLLAMSRYGENAALRSAPDALNVKQTGEKGKALSSRSSIADAEVESLVRQYANEEGSPSRAELKDAVRQYREVEYQYFNQDGSPKAGAMQAPNGKPTKLNKTQWIQIRTDNFKAWFGDWEQALQEPIPLVKLIGNEIKGSTPAKARNDAKAYIGKLIDALIRETGADTLRNQRAGLDIRLTPKGVTHGFQHQGAAHVKAVAGIRQLIENAAKIATLPHEPTTPEWKAVHTLVAPLKIGDKWYAVKLTAKESPDGRARLYDHQVLEMAKPDGIYGPLSDYAKNSVEKLGDRPASGLTVSVKQMLTAFKDDNSKYLASQVVDENGEPMVVYHGTQADFNAFDGSAAPYTFADDASLFFFTSSNKNASGYAEDNGLDERTNGANVMPVHLAFKNPGIITIEGKRTSPSEYFDEHGYYLIPDAKSGGNDGLIVENLDTGEKVLVAFNPNQIKSATGNTGVFGESGDIRFSRSPLQKAKNFFTGNDRSVQNLSDLDTILATGRMPQEKIELQSMLDKSATLLVDSSRPFDEWTRILPDQIEAGQLILAKDRAKRRVAVFEGTVLDRFLKPLAKEIEEISKKHKLDYRAAKELIGQWLTVRYSIEKNQDYIAQDQKAVNEALAELNKDPTNPRLKGELTKARNKQTERINAINEPRRIDPTEETLEAGLAGGYNTFTAKLYMKNIEAKIPAAKLNSAARHIHDMLAWKLQKDLDNGKITQEIVDTWYNSPHYVPLTGDPSVDTSEDGLFGHGNLNQAKDRHAVGRSSSLAQNGIDAAVEQTQKSARYHGWVDFKDKFAGIYEHLIQTELDNGLTQRKAQEAVFDQYHIARHTEAPASITDSSITIRKNGQSFVYDINNKVAVDALKSINKEDVPSLLQPLAWFTRAYARAVTQFMPGFGLINAIRDTWERTENIRTRTLPGYESINMDKVARNAIKTAVDFRLIKKLMSVMLENTTLKGKMIINEADPDINLIREMIEEGGTSTIGDYLSGTSATLSKQMRNSLGWSQKTLDLINAWNNSFELVSSYSIYKSLIEAGVDKKVAAAGTLNLMNFGKSGTITGPLKALYVFVNPTMQGGHQMIKTLSTPKGKARAAAYLIAGMMLYTFLRAVDGDDDELGVNKMDEQGNFVLEPFFRPEPSILGRPFNGDILIQSNKIYFK